MKFPYLHLLALGLLIPIAPAGSVTTDSPSQANPPPPAKEILTSVPGESQADRDARMAWWRDAKFGMFIHWGVYYSQDQDWVNGGSAQRGGHWDKAQDRNVDDYVDRIVVPQVTELLTRYGDDTPALIWWDSPTLLDRNQASRIDAVVRKLRPGLIQNDRLYWGKNEKRKECFPGDIKTPEQTIPAHGFPGRDWETCMTLNDHWGYNAYDHKWKSLDTIIRNLCDIASKGGNYLLNVGPDSLGAIPEDSVKRLAEVGEWMKVNGEAIHGTTGTPFGAEVGSWSPTEKDRRGNPVFKTEWKWRATRKPGHIYLILFEWPADGKFAIPPYPGTLTGARLLADPSARLTADQNELGITISGLPMKAPGTPASVIDLTY